MKHCYRCKATYDSATFHKNQTVCKVCHAWRMRQYRRTLQGFLDQKYTAMSKRVRGLDTNCLHTVKGLPILSRQEFYSWCEAQSQLETMFAKYARSGFKFRWCPTVDRIDGSKGYTVDNMQFLYQFQNARKH